LQTETATSAPVVGKGDEEEGDDSCDAEPEEEEVASTAGPVGGAPTPAPTDVVVVPSTATVIPVQTAPYGNGTDHTIAPTAAASASAFVKSYY